MSEPSVGTIDRQNASGNGVFLAIVSSFRAHWLFFVVPGLFLGTNEFFLWNVSGADRASWAAIFFSFLAITLPAALFALFIVRLTYFLLVLKPESPLKALYADIRSVVTTPSRFINGLPVLAATFLFNKAMLDLKPNIPRIVPFSWDEAFMQLDRTLHFGVDPWVLLQPLFGHLWITFAVNLVYNFWFLALFGLWVWFGFRPDFSELRTRFFMSYMISWWIGGGLLALAFSSAGPCYYGLVGLTPDPYAPLVQYLNGTDAQLELWALDAQKLLWDGYTGNVKPAVGISAFPSMHNAMAMVFALAGWKISRTLGIILTINSVIILLASVHLGWHYAVDGYAGIIIAVFSWWLAGAIAQWFHSLSTSREFAKQLSP